MDKTKNLRILSKLKNNRYLCADMSVSKILFCLSPQTRNKTEFFSDTDMGCYLR